jgi:hypothetical protein
MYWSYFVLNEWKKDLVVWFDWKHFWIWKFGGSNPHLNSAQRTEVCLKFLFFFAFEYRFLQNPRKYHKKFVTYFLSIISQFFRHEYFIRIKGKITRKVEEKFRILLHHFSTFGDVHKLRNALGGQAICYEPLYCKDIGICTFFWYKGGGGSKKLKNCVT